jgi:hypothetical protein
MRGKASGFLEFPYKLNRSASGQHSAEKAGLLVKGGRLESV